MPYTYAQIRKLQEQYGMNHLSTSEFSALMDQVTGSKAFGQGQSGMVGNAIKAASYGVDQALNKTTFPQAFGDMGADMFGDAGRHAFEHIPRTAINLLPMALGGPLGLAGVGATFGTNTYADTGSVGAGVISGTLGAVAPGIGGRIGGALTRGVMKPTLTEPIAGNAMGLLRGPAAQAAVKGGTATSIQAGGQIANPVARSLSYLGTKAGEIAGLSASGGAVNAYMAPKGQGWNAFSDAFSAPSLAASTLSFLPFLAKDAIMRGVKGPGLAATEAKFQQDYDNTLGKYNEARYVPYRDTMGGLAGAVQNRLTQMALPEFSQTARAFEQQQGMPSIVQNTRFTERRHQDAVREVNETAHGPFNMPGEVGVLRQPDLRLAVNDQWKTLSPEAKVEVLTNGDPVTKIESALIENNTPKEAARQDVETLVQKGVPLDVAVQEVAQREVVKATERVGKTAVQKEKESTFASTQTDLVNNWLATASPEHKAAYESALASLSAGRSSKDATQIVTSSLKKWIKETGGQGDVASLQQMLSGGKRFAGSKQRDLKTRTPISETNGETATVADGKKNKIKYYDNEVEARQVREQLKVSQPNFQWTVDPVKQKDGSTKYQILRYEWAERGGQAAKPVESISIEEHAKELESLNKDAPLAKAEKSATRDEHKTVLKAVERTNEEQFVDNVSMEDYVEMGSGDAALGRARLEATLKAGKVPKEDKTLFKSDQEVADFVSAGREAMRDFYRQKNQAFLGTEGTFAAGGGFFYNLAPLDFERMKIGKHQLPRNGVVPEALLTKIGRGNDRPLTKDEVELLKVVVPEAFVNGQVDLPTLFRELPGRRPVVEVKELKTDFEDGRTQAETPEGYMALHELETLGYQHAVIDGMFQLVENGQPIEISTLPENVQALFSQVVEHGFTAAGDRAQFYSVAPKELSSMPGYVEGLVRVPIKGEYQPEGGETRASRQDQGIKYTGPHFGEHDTNVVGFFRGYMETLPDGKKAFHVIEVQSDWGQARRKAEGAVGAVKVVEENGQWYLEQKFGDQTRRLDYESKEAAERAANQARQNLQPLLNQSPQHPLLSAYENLTLKAAIQHAKANGAEKIILSDAETAMMSEGHDRQGGRFEQYYATEQMAKDKVEELKRAGYSDVKYQREDPDGPFTTPFTPWYVEGRKPIKQEGGMRLHYDTTLPSEMQKILGVKGEPVELGEHTKSEDTYPGGQGSPVFKTKEGKPKTQITGRAYDLSKVNKAGFGGPEEAVREQTNLANMLKESGLSDPAHQEVAAKLLGLFDTKDLGYGLLAKGGPEGLFTQKTTGQRAVWLASQLGERAPFVLAHELSHNLFALAESGKLDAESANRLRRYAEFVGENTPEDNKVIMREMLDMLPENLKKDEVLRKLVDETTHDPEEVLANINAVVALTMANAKPSAWRSFMKWMPKPLTDFIAVSAMYGRRFFEAISGVAFMRRLGVLPERMNLENEKQLHKYIDTLYDVMKFDNQRAEDARMAMRLDTALTPGAEMGALLDGSIFQHPQSAEGEMIVKAFGLGKKDDGEAPVTKKPNFYQRVIKGPYDRFFNPLLIAAQQDPKLLRAASRGAHREAVNNRLENEWLKPLGLHHDGVKVKADKASPVLEVERTPELARFRDQLQQRAQVMRSTVGDLIAAKDRQTMDILQRMTPENQQKVREAIIRQQEANIAGNKQYESQSLERSVYQVGEAMMLKDPTLTEDQARVQAQQIVDNLYASKPPVDPMSLVPPTPAQALGAEMAGKLVERIRTNVEKMNNDPGYISARRFGDYKFRLTRKDGSTTVIDARTEGEQTDLMRKYQEAEGDNIVSMVPLPLTKGNFDFKQAALDMLETQEAGMQEQLKQTLLAHGIDDATATEIAGNHSAAAALKKELAAKNLPTLSLKRNFKEGWEELDMLNQQMEYQRMMTRGLTKGTAKAEQDMILRDPSIRDHSDVATIKRAWELYTTPDPKSVSAIQKFNYAKFLAFHFLNMAQDAVYPWLGTLAPLMIADGAGVGQTYKGITGAAVKLKTGKMSAEEEAMLQRYREGNRGIATYSDEANNAVLEAVNARRVAEKKDPYTMGQFLSKPFGMAMLFSKGLHKKFTDFSTETSMLAAYDHFRTRQKMSPSEAEKAAFDMVTTTIGGGKAGRAVGIWDSGKMKPVSAALTSLQTFGFLQMGTWKLMAEKALGQIPGLTKSERANALKAFGVQSATMFATAGIFGLPLVGAILASLDKMFGINSKEAIADWLQSDTSDDHTVQQVALHGLINQFGGIDYASRGSTPGVLGLNPQSGFSMESLAGPTYSLLKDLFGGASDILQGEVAQGASRLLPNNLKRPLQLWRDDWDFRQKDGTLIDETGPLEKGLYGVFGLKPARIASMQERDQWQRVDAEIQKVERRNWLDGVVDDLTESGPQAVQQAIAERVKDRPTEDVNALARAVAEKAVDKMLPYDPRKQPGSSSQLNQTTGARLPDYNEVQRLQLVQQVMQAIGINPRVSQSRWRNASMVDRLRLGNPGLSYEEAMDIIQSGRGSGGHSSLGGLGGLGSLSLGGLGSL